MTAVEPGSSMKSDWVQVLPEAVVTGMDSARPVMIFKEKNGEERLPVWLSPLDAGIAITQEHVSANASSPHDLASRVFQKLGLKLDRCLFTEVRGNQQYVELHFKGHPEITKMVQRADQVISFCLHERTHFFCTRKYMKLCREQEAQIKSAPQQLRVTDSGSRRSPYLM